MLRLAAPALGALAAGPLYVLADTAIVGHLGTPQLAALALAGALLTALIELTDSSPTAPPPRSRGCTAPASRPAPAGSLPRRCGWRSGPACSPRCSSPPCATRRSARSAAATSACTT